MDPNYINIVVPGQPIFLIVIIPLIAAAIAGLGGALVGGHITSKSTREAVRLEHEMELKRQQQFEEIALQHFYEAIYTELNSSWRAYMSNLGLALERLPAGKAFDSVLPFWPGCEEFPVYKAHLEQIGKIPNSELRISIVQTYAKFEGMVATALLNNKLLEEFIRAGEIAAIRGRTPEEQLMQMKKRDCIDYAESMKELHNELKSDVTSLLATLKQILEERG